jgi:glycosyltransferase involved in cell wall biosynthesis
MGKFTNEFADGVFCYIEDAKEVLREHGIDCDTFHPEEDDQGQTKTLQFDEGDYDQIEIPQGQENNHSQTDAVQLQQEDPGQTVGQYESDGGGVNAPISSEERTQLLFVGRFVEGKGVEKLPAILDLVCEERPGQSYCSWVMVLSVLRLRGSSNEEDSRTRFCSTGKS